jgi:siroheme synthase
VRFKGGDPFVLGRGGEELLACLAAVVHVEVVPGVTSAFAVPAAAGIPVTHRNVSRQVTVLTAHDTTPDWSTLADIGDLAAARGVRSPAVVVVGPVVALAESLVGTYLGSATHPQDGHAVALSAGG